MTYLEAAILIHVNQWPTVLMLCNAPNRSTAMLHICAELGYMLLAKGLKGVGWFGVREFRAFLKP